MKKSFASLLACCLACLLLACQSGGPKGAVDKLAEALEQNNTEAFLAQIDMDAYAANFLKTMTSQMGAFNALNSLGKMFGLGNIDELVNSIVNVKARLSEQFTRGVASGELMAQCRAATTPDCPWEPESLRKAQIKEIDATAAIAKVTTPERLTCWLALHKFGNRWLVVGRAVLEADAKALAQAAPAPQERQKPASAKQAGTNI